MLLDLLGNQCEGETPTLSVSSLKMYLTIIESTFEIKECETSNQRTSREREKKLLRH